MRIDSNDHILEIIQIINLQLIRNNANNHYQQTQIIRLICEIQVQIINK